MTIRIRSDREYRDITEAGVGYLLKERKNRMDIETMRGEIIEHKNEIQILKAAVADLQVRVTKLENEINSDQSVGSNDPPPNS